jgi:hypothetical protein
MELVRPFESVTTHSFAQRVVFAPSNIVQNPGVISDAPHIEKRLDYRVWTCLGFLLSTGVTEHFQQRERDGENNRSENNSEHAEDLQSAEHGEEYD